jgi:hypothetical protein
MWQDQQPSYASSSAQPSFYGAPQGQPLQFYSPDPAAAAASGGGFYAARPSMDSQHPGPVAQGSINTGGGATGYGGSIAVQGGWLSAFGTGGFEGEPPLLEGASSDWVL